MEEGEHADLGGMESLVTFLYSEASLSRASRASSSSFSSFFSSLSATAISVMDCLRWIKARGQRLRLTWPLVGADKIRCELDLPLSYHI